MATFGELPQEILAEILVIASSGPAFHISDNDETEDLIPDTVFISLYGIRILCQISLVSRRLHEAARSLILQYPMVHDRRIFPQFLAAVRGRAVRQLRLGTHPMGPIPSWLAATVIRKPNLETEQLGWALERCSLGGALQKIVVINTRAFSFGMLRQCSEVSRLPMEGISPLIQTSYRWRSSQTLTVLVVHDVSFIPAPITSRMALPCLTHLELRSSSFLPYNSALAIRSFFAKSDLPFLHTLVYRPIAVHSATLPRTAEASPHLPSLRKLDLCPRDRHVLLFTFDPKQCTVHFDISDSDLDSESFELSSERVSQDVRLNFGRPEDKGPPSWATCPGCTGWSFGVVDESEVLTDLDNFLSSFSKRVREMDGELGRVTVRGQWQQSLTDEWEMSRLSREQGIEVVFVEVGVSDERAEARNQRYG